MSIINIIIKQVIVACVWIEFYLRQRIWLIRILMCDNSLRQKQYVIELQELKIKIEKNKCNKIGLRNSLPVT